MCPDDRCRSSKIRGHVGKNTGGVIQNVNISINDMSTGTVGFGLTSVFEPGVQCSFNADVSLPNGVPAEGWFAISSRFESGSSINLNNKDVAGRFWTEGGGSGAIVNGGQVTGTGQVALGDDTFWTSPFAGSAEFAGVASGGLIHTRYGADLTGKVGIGGSMAGAIEIADGMRGQLTIDGDLSGRVEVAGQLSGDVVVHGNLESTGAVDVGALATRRRVLVDGLCDGPISIDAGTEALSLINLVGGLGPSGQVRINDAQCDGNAKGDVWVGSSVTLPPLSPIDFDGCLNVFDCDANACPGCTAGGDLNGDITIVGCHADGDILDICVEGDVNGSIKLIQSLCNPGNATFDPTDCPACP